jgi:hypothetical protein
MRKVLLIVVTFIALVGVFTLFFLTQTKYRATSSDDRPVDKFSDAGTDNNQIFKPGSGAWSKQFDKSGNLYYQFKCDYYDPQPDGTVKVTHPVIQFFLSGGQVMQIEGKDGIIRFAQGTDKGVLSNSPTEPPRYGSLRDVVVKLFSNADVQNPGNLDMTMTMTNAQFDNDTFRLFTQEYTDDAGKLWHEDEIPVTVKAWDYSFIGSGLVLYWNDIDKRLNSLQIAHGKDLTLYDAGDLSPKATSAAPPPPAPTPSPAPQPADQATTVPSAPAPRYTATFYDKVRVMQGGNELVDADQMDVDFAPKGANSPAPAQSPTTAPGAPQSVSPAPVTQPASTPEPIHILWHGPMQIVPTDLASAPPLGDGKAIVSLLGSPVRIHQFAADNGQTVDLQCKELHYRTEDSSAHLSGNVEIRQTRADGTVSTVTGNDLDFSRLTHLALFQGTGSTKFPDPNDPGSVLNADWQKSCAVSFYDLPNNQTEIQHADLEGDVVVDHPKFHLTAGKSVQLNFDTPPQSDSADTDSHHASSPPLREIIADGNADCIVHEAKNQDRHISGQTLKLTRDPGPDGKLYAHQILCTGSVVADQGDEQLSAEGLQIDLLPTTRKSESTDDLSAQAALDHLTAWNNVIVKGKDGSYASAGNLEVQMVEDHPHITLSGSADQPAIVKSKTSTLTGWTIQFAPHDQTALIDGPGSFDGVQQSQNPNEPPHPLKLTWQHNASLDGIHNQVIVDGAVNATSNDGPSQQSAACDRIIATLVDVAPTTAPTRPTNQQAIADGADFMKNKQVRLLSMEMNPPSDPANPAFASVQSYAQDANGFLLHQYTLLSRKIDFDPQPQAKSLNVPGPGRILAVEQTPPSTTQPASAIGGPGKTAIEWQKQFTYDDTAHTADIEGDITLVHTGSGPKAQALQLYHADRVTADFYAQAATKPSAADLSSAPHLKELTATGPMVIRSGDKTIDCGEIDFDPAQQLLTCRGGQLGKVHVVDATNLSGGAFDEAVLDLKTNEIRKMTNVTGQGQ